MGTQRVHEVGRQVNRWVGNIRFFINNRNWEKLMIVDPMHIQCWCCLVDTRSDIKGTSIKIKSLVRGLNLFVQTMTACVEESVQMKEEGEWHWYIFANCTHEFIRSMSFQNCKIADLWGWGQCRIAKRWTISHLLGYDYFLSSFPSLDHSSTPMVLKLEVHFARG